MPSLNFTTSFGKNTGLVISPATFLERYFHGISICDKSGRRITEDTILSKIRWASEYLEEFLQIKLTKQIIRESRDFIRTEYNQWGFTQVTYPVRQVLKMDGFIGTTSQVLFPKEWLAQTRNSDEKLFRRTIHIVPSGNTAPGTNATVYVGIAPNAGYYGLTSIPEYWTIDYCTGLENIPWTIIDVVGKLAAMQIFAITGDIVLGSGIAAQSLSFDGLSQNIQTTQSAENSAHSARIRQYQGELKTDLPILRDTYRGIQFLVV